MIKRACLILASLLLLGDIVVAQTTLSCGVPQKSFDNAAIVDSTAGTPYALYSNVATISWQTSFAVSGSAISLSLQVSNDATIWSGVDTSTNTAGEIRTVTNSGYRFVRAYITSHTGGSGLTVVLNCIRQTGGGSGQSGYTSVEDEGSALTGRHIINFTGPGSSCVDDGSSKTICTISAGGAPPDAEYVVSTANPSLSAERVCTDTTTIDCDAGTAGQMKFNLISPLRIYNGATNYSEFTSTATVAGRAVSIPNVAGDLHISGSSSFMFGDVASHDRIQVTPTSKGATPKIGTITSSDLTDDRNWSFPDANGTIVLGTPADDAVMVGNGSTWAAATLPNGLVSYSTGTNSFSLGAAIIDPGSNGILSRTALNTVVSREITSTDGSIVVSNGNGVAGNPDISVDNAVYERYTSGTATPSANCVAGSQVYAETDRNHLWFCSSTNTWTDIGPVDVSALVDFTSGTATPSSNCTAGKSVYAETDRNALWACTSTNTWTDLTIGGSAYATIQDEGSGLTQRTILNFAGAGVSCADDTSKTTCTVTSGSGAPSDAKYIVAELNAGLSAEIAPSSDDQIPTSDSSTAVTWRTVPNCTDTGGNHLNYTQSSNSWSCGTSSSGSSSFDPGTTFTMYEEFLAYSTTVGTIGTHGWWGNSLNSGTSYWEQTIDAGHPGAQTLNSSTGDNSGYVIAIPRQDDIAFPVSSIKAKDWDFDAVARLDASAITNFGFWIGFGSAIDESQYGGIRVRYDTDDSDTTFMFQLCNANGNNCLEAGDASGSTVVASTITPSVNTWYRFRIRHRMTGVGSLETYYFRVNDETEKTFCSSGCDDVISNAPSSGNLAMIAAGVARASSTTREVAVDYVYFNMTGLSRY